MSEWRPIETAPKDGTRFRARRIAAEIVNGSRQRTRRITWWGKASHVPLYGWCHGQHWEDVTLWEPTHWVPLPDPPEDSK